MSTSENPSLAITSPKNKDPADVAELMPMSGVCAICDVQGTKDDNGLQFQYVYLKIYPGEILAQNESGAYSPAEEEQITDEVISSPTLVGEKTATTWEYSQLGDSPCSGVNTLVAVGEWYLSSEALIVHKLTREYFTAREVESCGGLQATKKMSLVSSNGGAASFVDLYPTTLDGDRLTYHLRVDAPLFGNRLLLPDGQPLRASTLEVAAPVVGWHHDATPFSRIQRPYGTHLVEAPIMCRGRRCARNRNWQILDAPAYSTVVRQQDPRVQHVVTTQDSSKPDLVSLNEDQDVFAQVNDLRRRGAYDDNTGTVELTVELNSFS